MRVLVVDDSALYRRVISDAITSDPNVEVVGTAVNGSIALDKVEQLQPDLITLDVEMPELDGLGVLRELKTRNLNVGTIMLSSLTDSGARTTTQACRLGAFDFVLKPNESSLDANRAILCEQLLPKISAYRLSRLAENPPDIAPSASRSVITSDPRPKKIVVIGISTGGPAALSTLLPSLPQDFPVPVVIVQHMPAIFTRSLADDLDRHSALTVREAEDGDRLVAGEVLIAPGGRQSKVVDEAALPVIRVNDDPAERNCRPSVDYTFRSAASTFGGQTLGIIMTGMGDDGLRGCQLIKRKGASVIAQDADTCVVYGMPRQIVEAGLADEVLPLNEIASAMMRICSRKMVACP